MHVDPYGPLHIPNDPATARIGGKPNARYDNSLFTPFYPAKIGRQPPTLHGKKIGYIVHAHCWVLFERVLGTKPTQRNFTKPYTNFQKKYWHKNELLELEDSNVFLLRVEPTQMLSTLELGCDI